MKNKKVLYSTLCLLPIIWGTIFIIRHPESSKTPTQTSRPKKIKIERKSKSSYPFVLVGDASKFSKSGFMSVWNMFTKGSVDFILKGKIKAGIFGLAKKWKLDYLYKMSWQEFMSFF